MVKPGYKQTEIGVFPEDWDVLPMKSLTTLMTNGFVGTIKSEYVPAGTGVLYLQGFNIQENAFDLTGVTYVSQEFHKKHLKSELKKHDLLTVQTGEIGVTAFLPEEYKGANCQALIISRFLDNYDARFWSYYFNSIGRKSLTLIETGTTMKHINVGNMKEVLVPVPALKTEQTHIAEMLSDVDQMIVTFEELLLKKKAIKQGAMQELLTGKKRLPGFFDEWKSDMLPNILQKDMGIKIGPFGSQLKKEYLLDDGPYRVYGQENVFEHDFTIGTRYLSKERFQQLQSCEICPGDFLISTMGTIGKCAIVSEGLHKGIMDSHLIRLRIDKQKILPEYLLHLFSEELGYLKNQTSKLSVGGIMDGLSTKIVNSLTVYFPVNLVEQQAIAKVLTDLDSEVKALEQKLEKYRQFKQGMMQQLLTGKIRLV